MNWLAKFKGVTHAVAVAGGLALTWAFSDQGREVIGGIVKAYPKASGITLALGFLATLFHSPKA